MKHTYETQSPHPAGLQVPKVTRNPLTVLILAFKPQCTDVRGVGMKRGYETRVNAGMKHGYETRV